MKFVQTPISGVWVIEPGFRADDRGRFFRAWCLREFEEQGIHFVPVQANMGFSIKKGTLRGMHYQVEPAAEAKLVRCTKGAMFDVAIDLRSHSPTYKNWFGIDLSSADGKMLYLPEGCAHGYQTLEDETEMFYMTSQYYAPHAARGARYNDPAFAIRWPVEISMISGQDQAWPLTQ